MENAIIETSKSYERCCGFKRPPWLTVDIHIASKFNNTISKKVCRSELCSATNFSWNQ